MYIEQMYTGCLSEAAYYIESNGEAAIVDPIRETEPYIKKAEKRGAQIKYIFETHFHADFVSGHIDLAKITGATIVYGPEARPKYDVHVARDGEKFLLGDLTIEVMHTPGHTPESSCYLLHDADKKPHALFSGDTLFVGDVGRPDLAIKSDPPRSREELARMMFHSLNTKIKPLPEDVILYPAHGPGSSCGKNLGPETTSTIGKELKTNYALQEMTEEEFVEALTTGLTAPPSYFFEDARINMEGYESIDSVMTENMKALSSEDIEKLIKEDVLILDTRHPDEFEKGHIPGAMNIGLNGSYAVWVGTLINIDQPLAIVAAEGKEEESILRLARVGYENVKGYLEGGMQAWKSAGKDISGIPSIEAGETSTHAGKPGHRVLDVRKCSEWDEGHVEGSVNIPLQQLSEKMNELSKDETYLIHCKSGYRSMVASSILKKAGFVNIVNIRGGFDALENTDIPKSENPVPA